MLILLSLLMTAQISLGADSGDNIVMQEVWIPMRDGVRLAADIYFPKGREPGAEHPGEALPVLLEYLPYRKTESRPSRYALFSYFIRHGYIVARVDIRGTGNSKGQLVEYEYSEQEQQDGEDIIAWLAILVLDKLALAVARTSDVNAGYDVAMPDEVREQGIP